MRSLVKFKRLIRVFLTKVDRCKCQVKKSRKKSKIEKT